MDELPGGWGPTLDDLATQCGIEAVGGDQCFERLERRGRPYRRVTAAVDQLLDLDEELRLADAAAAALEVEAGAERLALRIMIADAQADVADFLDGAEIERAAPDEGADLVEESLAQRDVAAARPRAVA